jgi:hypothetical protein
MTKAERVAAIQALEQARGSRVITYLTADRGVATTPVSEDVLRIAYDHLVAIGETEQIDLLLYTRGGDAMLPWPLVNAIRSFCKRFCVLVPFRAHSAGTLIALGADEIVMTPIGQLTPVEPTIRSPFTPPDPANPGRTLGINVEDVASFMTFVEERAGITGEEGRTAALAALAREVNPIALGNLHRSHKLAKEQATRLLSLHMDPEHKQGEIERLVENVVTTLWAHEYKIGRAEARKLGLKAVDADGDAGQKLWELFAGYEDAMVLRTPLQPMASAFPAGAPSVTITDVKMAYVESSAQTDVFMFDYEMTRPIAPTVPGSTPTFGPQVQIAITRQQWSQE